MTPEDKLRATVKFGQHKTRCPWCHETHSKQNKLATDLSTHRDAERIVFKCHRCEAEGIIPLRDNVVKFEPRTNEPPRSTRALSELPPLQSEHIAWLSARRLSLEAAQFFNCYAASWSKGDAIGFPYIVDGAVDASKVRLLAEKNDGIRCWQAPRTFFGIQHVKEGDDLLIVEGEPDTLAMKECGVAAVSVPNGAPKTVKGGTIDPANDDGKWQYVWNSKAIIDAAPKIILAVDMDEQGDALAEELARRIGKAKCWRVRWREKDANEVLIKHGVGAVLEDVNRAEPWPVEGLYDVEHFAKDVRTLYTEGLGRGAPTGWGVIDEIYSVAPGQLTTITGLPGSGKSEWADNLMVNLACNLNWRFAVCSFENEPRLHIAKLISKRVEAPFFRSFDRRRVSETELEAGLEWVKDHFLFVHQDNGDLADLDSIIERLKAAVMRYGVRGVICDPYNFIARPRDMSETEFVSLMMTRLKVFAMAHGVHVWLVAHPQKLQRGADGKYAPPRGYEISGSANFFNKTDNGITIHRDMDEAPFVQVHVWKIRYSWCGQVGEAKLIYDRDTTTYKEPRGETEDLL